jgi:hypothetical protein
MRLAKILIISPLTRCNRHCLWRSVISEQQFARQSSDSGQLPKSLAAAAVQLFPTSERGQNQKSPV